MADLELVPVRTRILTHNDDIVDAIKEYSGQITDRDIICTAESVVAITQNRYVRPEELKPSWQARLMNRFVPGAGSMARIYGMHAGKNGVFYAHCRQASLCDDVTGTMPPYDKAIVYGPADTNELCEEITRETGAYGAVVADVNDLKRAAILGHSKGINPKKISKILIHNPFGNASEKTPIVIIKNFADKL